MLSSGNVNKININSDLAGSFQAQGPTPARRPVGLPQGGLGIAGALLLAPCFPPPKPENQNTGSICIFHLFNHAEQSPVFVLSLICTQDSIDFGQYHS